MKSIELYSEDSTFKDESGNDILFKKYYVQVELTINGQKILKKSIWLLTKMIVLGKKR